MTSTRKLASALCLATCFSLPSKAQQLNVTGLDPTQTYTTENIVNQSSWNGAINSPGPCFGTNEYYQGINCGPAPSYNPATGNINFSYGYSTIYQMQNIASAIPYTGTGLQVNGFNFSFAAKNGNYWDDARLDQLSAFTYFRDSNGNIVDNNNWNLNYIFNWTNFSFDKTFTSPYKLSSLSTVTYGFTGTDNNFWFGTYGPEIRDVSFRLKYSFDPCVNDPLYSASCPGYTQAFLASLPKLEPVVETAPIVATTTEPAPTVSSTTPIAQQPVAQSTTTETAPAATVASAPTTTESQSSGGSRVSLSTILSIVANEQSRIAGVEKSTVEQSVEQSVKEADKATQQAESIAASATSESISVSIASAQSQVASDQQQANQSSGGGLSFFSVTSLSASPSDSSVGLKLPESNSSIQQATNQTEEKTESAVSFSGFSAVNVLKEEESKPDQGMQTQQKTETVKRNVPNNELAGNITLASLGSAPQGFQAYSTIMPDAAFYAPKEIYKNQVVVDNRAGRRMFSGSDNLHQQMVDQQYK